MQVNSRRWSESYISLSISFMRTSEKHPKVRFSRKMTHFFVFFHFFFAHVTFVEICNLMQKTASKSVNNFSSYKRTNTHTYTHTLLFIELFVLCYASWTWFIYLKTSGFAASRVQSEAYRSDDRRSRAFGARFSIYKSFRMPIIYLHTWIQTLTRTHARERNVKLFGSILTYSTPMKNL